MLRFRSDWWLKTLNSIFSHVERSFRACEYGETSTVGSPARPPSSAKAFVHATPVCESVQPADAAPLRDLLAASG